MDVRELMEGILRTPVRLSDDVEIKLVSDYETDFEKTEIMDIESDSNNRLYLLVNLRDSILISQERLDELEDKERRVEELEDELESLDTYLQDKEMEIEELKEELDD